MTISVSPWPLLGRVEVPSSLCEEELNSISYHPFHHRLPGSLHWLDGLLSRAQSTLLGGSASLAFHGSVSFLATLETGHGAGRQIRWPHRLSLLRGQLLRWPSQTAFVLRLLKTKRVSCGGSTGLPWK